MSQDNRESQESEKEISINQTKQSFPIAGIGASAGGLDAIKKLLENLPLDSGLAFVVLQHLAPDQESMLPEILSRTTKIPVQKVKNGMIIEPNNVYVIPAGKTMTISKGCLELHPKTASLKPIDEFLTSLASEKKTHAIGIILSGTGTDGTEGLRAIKAEGGITFAQDPQTAQYPDMPKSAIAAETVYIILAPEQIGEELSRIAKHPEIIRQKVQASQSQEDDGTELKTIFSLLKTVSGVNFSNYKKPTINRRIARRMIINKIENKKDYIIHLRAHPEEQQALFDDLLISVTFFFREPNTFLILKEKVFPEFIKNDQPAQLIRIWIPGCSTGEETYSMAMSLLEFLEEKKIDIPVQIFGTDVNVKNIEKSRRGIYPRSIEDNVSESRLKRFFNKTNENYQVIKQIRDMCVFAKHDLTQDPPFSNLDLIVCRNLLIYIESQLQERILPIFNYALKPDRFLVLGESESIGKFTDAFEPIIKRGPVFKKKRGQLKSELPIQLRSEYVKENPPLELTKPSDLITELKEEIDRLLMAQYVPATLLVNENSEILIVRGQVDPYLSIEPGTPSLNISKLVRKELRAVTQTAIYRAKKTKKENSETVRFEQKGQTKTVNIQVKPIKNGKHAEPYFLVLFNEISKETLGDQRGQTKTSQNDPNRAKDQQINELSEELESAKQTLQTVNEQQEATNEELRSANEEVQSSNEELMSTNEELETSKEELQSTNEELTTLNDELKNRNLSLSRLNDDLNNLLINVDTAVVIVDNQFRIKRLTTSAQELLRLTPSDLEHPITDFRLGIPIENLEKPLSIAITKLSIVRKEIKTGKDRWYQMRIRPYITEEKKIGGAVLSFADITEIKKWENEKKQYTQNLEQQVKEQASKLIQSENFATIGKTAGMVGHDIRNPLQAIVGELYLAKKILSTSTDEEAQKELKETITAIEKQLFYINKIVTDLQDFSKTTSPQISEVNVEKNVQEALAYNIISNDVEVTFVIEKDFPLLKLDATYLRRILTNLITNAAQAMPKGGKLTVNAFRQEDKAVISVSDTGEGIPEEIRNKIFTPLFTTKAKGQGFGLPVVKKLTEEMHGTVTFESEKDKGTVFTLKFPIPQ